MEDLTFYTFEHYQSKAEEAKKLLLDNSIEVYNFEKEHREYVDMGPINFYTWMFNETSKIRAKYGNCKSYLEAFNVGDFEKCSRILEKGWDSIPFIIKEK